jgi:hypothetical protein
MRKLTTLAIATATLIAVASAPVSATHKGGVPHGQNGGDDSQTLESILSLLEPKTIFVTSMTYTGDLGGLAGADIICQGLADAPGSIVPEGEYVALLSTDNVPASARITPSSGPYIRPDGVPVAASFAALFHVLSNSVDLITPPSIDEMGGTQAGQVWTGSSYSIYCVQL